MPRKRTEASIPRAEQEARRALKLERKALDRAITGQSVHIPTHTMSRWNYARRIRANQRAHEGAYRDAAARIGEIHKQLTEPRA